MRRWNGAGWALAVAMVAGVVVTPRLAGAREAGLEFLSDMVGWVTGHGSESRVVEVRTVQARQASDDQGDEFRWSGRVEAGRTLEIKGVNGPIEAVLADGDEVVVTAEKSARRSDPSEVRIEVVEHGGDVTVCAVYPSRDDSNRCDSGDRGRNNTRNNDVKVAFHIEVPRGVRFEARTVNGEVEAISLESDVDAATVNGDVEVSTTGFARAATVNGSIEASMGRFSDQGVEFKTVNGSIEIDVPDAVNADLEARWLNGRLDSSLPLKLQGRISRHSASGMLGEGGPTLRLETVNGSIRIR